LGARKRQQTILTVLTVFSFYYIIIKNIGGSMSVRSYSKVWLHIIWGTQNREKSLTGKELRKKLSNYLHRYSKEKSIYMKINYVNADHVHVLIDLPTDKTIAEVLQLLKGSSSYWVSKEVNYKFAWAKGYGVFSVSESIVDKVVKYIMNQEEHHRVRSFAEEYEDFIKKHKVLVNR